MDQFSGGNWSMIPNVQAQGNFGTPTNQDHLFLQQQQQQFQQQQQQFQPQQQQQEMQFQQFQQQQFIQQQQQFHQQQQHRLLHSPPSQQHQSSLQSPPTVVHTPQSMMHTPQQQQQLVQTPQQSVQTPQQQQHQSLASHFHLFPLVEKLSDAIESGTRDQNSDALVSELNGHFDKCQQLLNSISGSLGSKTTMTVDGQKRNQEESELLLQQRRDLIMEYKKSIEDLVKIEP